MNSQFKVIGIMGKVRNKGVEETLKAIIQFLKDLKQDFFVDDETASFLHDDSIPCADKDKLSQQCDLLIVVGGDGSLLRAAHTAVNDQVPVLGVNRGRLGFLTDINPNQLEKIKNILAGEYTLEKRFLLSANVFLDGQLLGTSDALNEAAIIPDLVPHMNTFEIYINDEFVLSQDSDGVIIASPTGSTAYALSGGGPILHPDLNAVVIVPMFPHTLSIRPIVIDGNQQIKIIISRKNSATPRLTCDGQAIINTPPGSEIIIQKKSLPLQLIHPLDYNYYETLRSKLHWGKKLHDRAEEKTC